MASLRVFHIVKMVISSVTCILLIASFVHYYRLFSRRVYVTMGDKFSTDDEISWFWKNRSVAMTSTCFIRKSEDGTAMDDIQAYRSYLLIPKKYSHRDIVKHPIHLDINGSDVLVMMHIQKTGGTTMENAMVQNTDIQPPCQCGPMPDVPSRLMCKCVNKHGQDWLFNRHAVGWPCGVHPGFNELTSCVDTWYRSQKNETRKRRYLYMTVLRDPVSRFISEWLHVRRGATWKECRLACDGRDATEDEVPFCFQRGTWKDVPFDEFMACKSNMAFNRQTRMLANLSLSGCYKQNLANMSSGERDEKMLASAKYNLARFFTFFGLLEHQEENQLLLEHTMLGLKMKKNFRMSRGAPRTNFMTLKKDYWERVIEKNQLDIRLYQYAKDLFYRRLKRAKISIQNESLDFNYVGTKFSYTEFDVFE